MASGLFQTDLRIFTVINHEYAVLGWKWGVQVRKVSGMSPHFVCADRESYDFLDAKGFPCTLELSERQNSNMERVRYKDSTFPSDKAAFTVSLKLSAARKFLQANCSVIYSDVDAIWLKDPIEHVLTADADIAFQPGSFPVETKETWGFAVCTGFFYLRPTANTLELSRQVSAQFDGSDQRTMNNILMEQYEINWSRRPSEWENCSIENGWIEAVYGVCRRTGLELAALPHALYQRHATTKEACNHAIICHPNSPKDQASKIAVIEKLGINIFSD